MPEHVHLLVSEPEIKTLAVAIQALKQSVSRKAVAQEGPFWLPRYYDFNVRGKDVKTTKLRYMHRNPVERGLVGDPADWEWSSYRHYQTGDPGTVEIESWWTQAVREKLEIPEAFLESVQRSKQNRVL
jgi:putative transposase